jgi:hypothetical protein
MSDRFYFVKIGSIYLTSDGTSAGLPCKVLCRGVESFRSKYARAVVIAASGKAYELQVDLDQEGKHFEVELTNCPVELYEALLTLLNTAEDALSTLRIIGLGLPSNFDVQAMPGENWLSTGQFSGGYINNVVLRFVSAGAGA